MGGADTLSRMRVKNGDLVVAALAAVLAIMHTGVLFSDWAGAADWAQALLSWGFVGALAVWRSHPRWSAALMVGLNAAWSALWILAPVNIGYTLWVVLVPLGVFTARRWCSTLFSRGVLAAALVWSFASPFMWTWGGGFHPVLPDAGGRGDLVGAALGGNSCGVLVREEPRGGAGGQGERGADARAAACHRPR